MIVDFAAQLRDLRASAGSPSFRELARRTHYSSSTLAEVTAGKRLPTDAVLAAFVTECGGDADEWLARLRQLIESARHRDTLASPVVPEKREKSPGNDRSRRRMIAWLAGGAAVFVIGGVAGGLLAMSAGGGADPVAAPFVSVPVTVPSGAVNDGADPAVAGCGADAVLADKSPVLIDGAQVGALELAYSRHCRAGWARLYLYPGQPTMMGLATVRANDGRSTSIAEPLVKQVNIYTDVILPGPSGCIGADAVVLETGHPAVTATITCQQPK